MIKTYLIKVLGGFASIEDTIAFIETKQMQERDKILTATVKRLYSTLSEDDILKIRKDGEWIFQGKVLSDGIKKQIIAEAHTFSNTKLWTILQQDVKYQANKKMFLHATDIAQLTAGKLWIYTIDCMKTRIESLAKGSGVFNG